MKLIQTHIPTWQELEPWLRLSLVPRLGAIRLKKLWDLYQSPHTILDLPNSSSVKHIPTEILKNIASSLHNPKIINQLTLTKKWLESSTQHHLIPINHLLYPPLLLEIPDPPTLLYLAGSPNILQDPQIAIVGSRKSSPYGRMITEKITKTLCESGLIITSGLAYGIDSAAHQTAVKHQHPTIAVLGTGVDRIYPNQNKHLATYIQKHGALVSEFPLGTPPYPGNFPKRNRLISGLSLGTLVVEATLSSGSLLTAKLAADQNRTVFAIPGLPDNPLNQGCHQLIRDGAILTCNGQHIINELAPLLKDFIAPTKTSSEFNTTKYCDYPELWQNIIHIMGNDIISLDDLIRRTNLNYEHLMCSLTEMEMAEIIKSVPGGYKCSS